MSCLASGPVGAAEDAGLAFVLGTRSYLALGSEEVPLPGGARLELAVDGRKTGGRYAVKVRPGGLSLPEIGLAKEGQELRVRLRETAAGWLTPSAGGLGLELAVTVEVELASSSEAHLDAYDLVLTTGGLTGPVSESAADLGEPVDRASRGARLVASGTVSPDSPLAPGEPLLVVLDGTFEGLPTDLR
jgi:hypothetical protein